jgi:hypothetical protein
MADALARMRERRAMRLEARLPTSRTCGACDLCCTAPGINEMKKPPGEPCRHLSGAAGHSCSIYASRPKVCIDFHCLWRMSDSWLPTWLYPEKCGFVLAFNNPFEWPGVVTVHVDPQRPEAWRSPWAITVFVTLAERWNCLVAIGQVPITTHIICPDASIIDVATNPHLMLGDGKVGAPGRVFGHDRRPILEHLRETVFVWDLPPPED